jgi:predicted GNAT family acetyltransferase
MGMDFITEQARIYLPDASGKSIASITFPSKDGTATIDRTFVDESLRGQGVAAKLVQAAVDKIQADGNNIAATCPYAAAWLKKHPEIPVTDTGAPTACRIDETHRK